MNEWIIATDIGKKVDSSVIGVGRKMNRFLPDGRCVSYLALVDLQMVERMPYTEQGDYILKLDGHRELHMNNDLIIDGTGVGEAVADILREKGLNPVKVIATSGSHVSEIKEKARSGFTYRTGYNVPKEDLVSSLKTSLEQRRFAIAEGVPFEEDIRKQFAHFVGVMSKSKNMIYNNDSNEVHDDIVFCLMLMNWYFMKAEGKSRDFRYKPSEPARNAYKKQRQDYDPFDYVR